MNPYAMFDYMDHGPFLVHCGSAHVDNVITSQRSKQSHGCSCLWNLPNPASGTFGTYLQQLSTTLRNLPLEPTPAHAGNLRTFWNLSPEPAPATCTGTRRSLSGLKTPLAYAVGEESTNTFLGENCQKQMRSEITHSSENMIRKGFGEKAVRSRNL